MTGQQQDILSLSPESLARWLDEAHEPPYRLDQILRRLHREYADSFDRMTELPEPLRNKLASNFSIASVVAVARLSSKDAQTEKFLFRLCDGEQIECVSMSDRGRLTFCISSQAGCALDCRFCATGAAGIRRNLTVSEILGQVTALARAKGGLRNIVFMGMGEPLLNCGAVFPALEALADARRLGLSPRHITISTAGITPAIKRLAKWTVKPNLALSLNSPFDEQRSELMPINRKYPLTELLDACEEYSRASGRRLLIEYVLIRDVNDCPAAAQALAEIARRLNALVNLISFNPVQGTGFEPPASDEISKFRSALERRRVEVTQRFRRGREIAAACGQLTGKHADAANGSSAPASRARSRNSSPFDPPRREAPDDSR